MLAVAHQYRVAESYAQFNEQTRKLTTLDQVHDLLTHKSSRSMVTCFKSQSGYRWTDARTDGANCITASPMRSAINFDASHSSMIYGT